MLELSLLVDFKYWILLTLSIPILQQDINDKLLYNRSLSVSRIDIRLLILMRLGRWDSNLWAGGRYGRYFWQLPARVCLNCTTLNSENSYRARPSSSPNIDQSIKSHFFVSSAKREERSELRRGRPPREHNETVLARRDFCGLCARVWIFFIRRRTKIVIFNFISGPAYFFALGQEILIGLLDR